jgi:hypothetical protein
MGRERNVKAFDIRRSKHMNNEISLIERLGQGLLATAATGATVVALQIAMLAA